MNIGKFPQTKCVAKFMNTETYTVQEAEKH